MAAEPEDISNRVRIEYTTQDQAQRKRQAVGEGWGLNAVRGRNWFHTDIQDNSIHCDKTEIPMVIVVQYDVIMTQVSFLENI